MDDGSGVLLPYMTLMRTFTRAHAEAGVEAVAALTQYHHHFAQQLNARMNGVDLTIPVEILLAGGLVRHSEHHAATRSANALIEARAHTAAQHPARVEGNIFVGLCRVL